MIEYTGPPAWHEGKAGELRRVKRQIKRMVVGDRVKYGCLTIKMIIWGDRSVRFVVYEGDVLLKYTSKYHELEAWLDDYAEKENAA